MAGVDEAIAGYVDAVLAEMDAEGLLEHVDVGRVRRHLDDRVRETLRGVRRHLVRGLQAGKRVREAEEARWYVMPEDGDGGIECSSEELVEHATRLGMVHGMARSLVRSGRPEDVATWMRLRGWRVERARK